MIRNVENRTFGRLVFWLAATVVAMQACLALDFTPDNNHISVRKMLEETQRAAFGYIWNDGCPHSGMAYEANFDWDVRPVAVGGTGFGIAAIVVAADRGWITRNAAVERLQKIVSFLLEKTERLAFHGAFPHWLNGRTGESMTFGPSDADADIVETSLLLQGLLIARVYFNGPGNEKRLADSITEIWEGVDWNWFTNGEEDGIYWHWSPERGYSGLKILGYNECLITYALAISSPTHPISRQAYDYWKKSVNYQSRELFGYELQAAPLGGGPLFLAHYSFVGLDPRRIADESVTRGFFVRGVVQTLSNRGYCLQDAPADNQYSEVFWGLTASQIPDGYAVNEPYNDSGTVAPAAALASMPYTPLYSFQMLRNLQGSLKEKVWGPYGPYDAINLRDDWVSDLYLAIDQLPIVCMIENYRTGLLWKLFMSIPEVRKGLAKAGLEEPELADGFPEAIVTVQKKNLEYVPDAYEMMRHPETGTYSVPYRSTQKEKVEFIWKDENEQTVSSETRFAVPGRNVLQFKPFMPGDGKKLTLVLQHADGEHSLPIRLH